MQFNGIDNPFGTDAFAPAASSTPKPLYHAGLRLNKAPVQIRRGPKPPSQHLKNYLRTYNG